jgi:hypothetical protein
MPSYGDDSVFSRPFETLGDGNHTGWNSQNNKFFIRFPQQLIASWVDFCGTDGGIAFDIRNDQFNILDFAVEKVLRKGRDSRAQNETPLRFAFAFHPEIGKDSLWNSCEIIIRIHSGDWHGTADIHREWLERFVKKVRSPETFRESLGWHFFFLKHQDGTVAHTYDDLPEIVEASLKAGINNILLFGWQQEGHDNKYPFGYYPNEDWGGAAKLREKIREAGALGCRIIPFFNGLLLDINTCEYKEFGRKWAITGRTGSPYYGGDWSRNNFDIPFRAALGRTTGRNMVCLDLCMTGKEAAVWEKETIRRIFRDYGFGNLQLDQIAQKTYLCYDKSHGHKTPEAATTGELMELLEAVRNELKALNPDGVIIGEYFNGMVSQYLDASWSWSQLACPEIPRYSLPWIRYSHETDALEFEDVNRCFVNGILLDLKIDGGDGYVSDYPGFALHLKGLAGLKKKIRETYIEGDYRDEEGVHYAKDSGVCVKTYLDRHKGKICIIAGNLKDEDNDLTLDLAGGGGTFRIFRMDDREDAIQTEGRISLVLGPYEVMALESERAGIAAGKLLPLQREAGQ